MSTKTLIPIIKEIPDTIATEDFKHEELIAYDVQKQNKHLFMIVTVVRDKSTVNFIIQTGNKPNRTTRTVAKLSVALYLYHAIK